VIADRLDAGAIAQALAGCPLGAPLHVLDSVTSTNALLQDLARDGAPQGTLVVAEEQTTGKGRLGRAWFSPSGAGIWMSLLVRPPATPHAAWGATVCGALGVIRGVLSTTTVHPSIMWPNDLFLAGRKVCGILTEVRPGPSETLEVVMGIGINVNMHAEDFPEDIRDTATSILAFSGQYTSRADLLVATVRGIAEAYGVMGREGLAPLLQPWRVHSAIIGRRVFVHLADRTVEGMAADVLESGALVVRTDGGAVEHVIAGDVRLARLVE
jgi:BirA family biotin operon repressor/biotin-[acetyl-CoA-carboxylase] ligase